jgi:nucleotide sugar dehydrogenase
MQKQTFPSSTQPPASSVRFSPAPIDAPAKIKNVVVVGLGYVGLPLALLARSRGHTVSGIDLDSKKRAQIKKGAVPDLDERSLKELRKGALSVFQDFSAVKSADVVIICVPTPVTHEYIPDLTPLKNACASVAKYMRPGQLIVSESTVHPGTAEEILIPLMENISGLKAGRDFGFAHCPERVNPGDEAWPVEKIPRVVGATTLHALKEAASFYRSIIGANVHEMSTIREAEAVKMVENSFRDINIAFVNELAMSFDKLGIDVTHVLTGASTKPFGFMLHSPGCGVGGHCIPVDPYYLIRYAKQNGFTHRFLSLAREINNHMPHFTVAMLEDELNKKELSLNGSTIALLGLSYKANVSDLRESPAFEIEKILKEKGAVVRTFDPTSLEQSSAKTLREALDRADAAVIATAHDLFKSLTPSSFLAHDVRIVVDGRNCLNNERFARSAVAYRGIGR